MPIQRIVVAMTTRSTRPCKAAMRLIGFTAVKRGALS